MRLERFPSSASASPEIVPPDSLLPACPALSDRSVSFWNVIKAGVRLKLPLPVQLMLIEKKKEVLLQVISISSGCIPGSLTQLFRGIL